MFFNRPAGVKFIDRGDPDAWDYTLVDFTPDETWRELDLSAILPVNTIAFFATLLVANTNPNAEFLMRKKGNIHTYNGNGIITQVANQSIQSNISIDCSVDRKVEYYGTTGGWSNIRLLINRFVVK